MSDNDKLIEEILRKKFEKESTEKAEKIKTKKEKTKKVKLPNEYYFSEKIDYKGAKYVAIKVRLSVESLIKTGDSKMEIDGFVPMHQDSVGAHFPHTQKGLKFYYDRIKNNKKGKL